MTKEPSISQNFKYNGGWNTLKLSESDIEKLRKSHRENTLKLMRQCVEDAGILNSSNPVDVTQAACALFEARADKFFTWIMRALKDKTKSARENGGFAVEEEGV